MPMVLSLHQYFTSCRVVSHMQSCIRGNTGFLAFEMNGARVVPSPGHVLRALGIAEDPHHWQQKERIRHHLGIGLELSVSELTFRSRWVPIYMCTSLSSDLPLTPVKKKKHHKDALNQYSPTVTFHVPRSPKQATGDWSVVTVYPRGTGGLEERKCVVYGQFASISIVAWGGITGAEYKRRIEY